MKRVHLLGVRREPEAFGPLVQAAVADGGRVGWLDLSGSATPPGDLEAAAALGVQAAVASGGGWVVSARRLRGEAAMPELLRKHFLGCRVVLVLGGAGLPLLDPRGSKWTVQAPGGEQMVLTLGELVAALRKPRPPWSQEAVGD